MSIILAVDPGTTESAWVIYETGRIVNFAKSKNEWLLDMLPRMAKECDTHLVLEMVASYGMPVGKEVFETVLWSGRFIQAHGRTHELIYRKDVKMNLCHSMKANDSSIRQALIDRYGGKDKAIGKKANQGPLYLIKADVWSALAVAITASDLKRERVASCPIPQEQSSSGNCT